MKQQSIKKNIVLSTLYEILKVATPLITAPYIARVLGKEGVGTYSFTSSIQMYFSLFAALGTATYGLREIARNRDDAYERSKLFWEIECLSICTSLICMIIWGVFVFIQKEYQIIYLILTLNLFNTMFDISWFYNGLEQFQYTVTKNSVIKIAGVILIFAFIKKSDDLVLYVFLMSLTTLLGTMSMWLTLRKFLVKIDIKKLSVFRHFRQTLVYFIPTIATSIYTVLDKTMIGAITHNAGENGYYEEATKIINIMKGVTFTALNSVLGSRISYLFKEERYDEIKERIELSINYVLFMGLGICFGLTGVAQRFVPVFFGPGFEKTIYIIYILSPIIVIIGISNCLGSQFYSPAGLRKESAMYIIMGSLTNLVLNAILIPNIQSYGAAIASVFAELTITILYVYHCRGYLKLNTIIKYGWKRIIAGIAMGVIVYNIGNIIQSGILALILQVSIGVFVYIIILILLKDELIKIVYDNAVKKLKLRKI